MEKFEFSSRKPREPGQNLSPYGPRWTPRRSRCWPVVSELLVASGGPARGGWAGDAHFGMEPLVRRRRRPGQGKLFHGEAQAWGVKV